MQILKDVASARHFINAQKRIGKAVGLVPTMGALHHGHATLVTRCAAENEVAVASIFVNPIQFNNPADLAKYPRTLECDIEILENVGCQAVFCPSVEEMYSTQPNLSIDFGSLEKTLEGKFRPGHFSGVGLVVGKLFNIIQPDVAYFGLKDFQQFLIVSQLVRDFSFPIKLVGCDIVREADGLAMSSRNQRLSPSERKKAALLYQALQHVKQGLSSKKISPLKADAAKSLSENGIRIEYLELAKRETLEILSDFDTATPSILLIAGYVGEVRLIDNLFV
jgi:pantoate--beta-alanine ligase